MPTHCLGVATLGGGRAIAEHAFLDVAEFLQKVSEAIEGDVPRVGEIRAPGREEALVDAQHGIEGTGADVEGREVGEEVVAHKVAEEHKVVDQPLQVIRKALALHVIKQPLELEVQIVPQHGHVHELPALAFVFLLGLGLVERARPAAPPAGRLVVFLLAQQDKVRFVRRQGEHDEVSVVAVDAVSHVGRVPWLHLFAADVLHDFVLPFAGHLVPRQDHGRRLPRRVAAHLIADVVVQAIGQVRHELGARRDAVGVKGLRGNVPAAVVRLVELVA